MKYFVLLLSACAWAQSDYDLLLKGGRVIDPKSRISAVRDVAIKDGRIAAIQENIPAQKAHKVVSVGGLYVVPGLVDIHVHVYAGTGMQGAYSGDNSVYPDAHALPSGVTTVVDAGSSGWRNFPDFKDRVIDRSRTRVLAFLNLVGRGMGGKMEVEQNLEDMNPELTATVARKYKGVIVGIKTAHYAGPEWTPVERAVKAGTAAEIPVMVDFGDFHPARPFEDLVTKKLRPGDIYTHTYLARVPMLDDEGHIRPFLLEARRRGVIFDVGHGGGAFIFRHAVPAIQQGFLPDSISTDLHTVSMVGGMKNMLNVMSKFLNMGMSLEDVILRSTWNPAREIRHEELGHLSPGAIADVAVLRVRDGDFGFVDVYGAMMKGSRKLECELTVKDGKVIWDLNGITRTPWDKLGKYGSLGDPRWDGTLAGTSHAGK